VGGEGESARETGGGRGLYVKRTLSMIRWGEGRGPITVLTPEMHSPSERRKDVGLLFRGEGEGGELGAQEGTRCRDCPCRTWLVSFNALKL